jgi:hypothetical protein
MVSTEILSFDPVATVVRGGPLNSQPRCGNGEREDLGGGVVAPTMEANSRS